jgi:hypothetical protein
VTRGISDVIYEDVENRVIKTVTNVLGRTKYVEYRVDRTVSSIETKIIWYCIIEIAVVNFFIVIWASGCCCFRACSMHPKEAGKVEGDTFFVSFDVYE